LGAGVGPSCASQSGTGDSAGGGVAGVVVGSGSAAPRKRAARSKSGAPAGGTATSRNQSGASSVGAACSVNAVSAGCSSAPRRRLIQSSDSLDSAGTGSTGCRSGGFDGVGTSCASHSGTSLSAGGVSGLTEADSGTSRAPHELQVALPDGFIVPHIGQRFPSGADSAVPHWLQA